MIELLQVLDRRLLLAANDQHSPLLDKWMIFFSERFVWFPAYLVLLMALVYLFGQRARLLLPLLLFSVALADSISSRFFKPFFARLRPCHDPELSATLNLAHGCGGQFGFMSSHAANSFALTVFLWQVLPRRYWLAKWLTLVWAILLSYSRIYLAAHYLTDVVAGALLGSLLAWGCATLYKRGAARWWPAAI
ncbi:undecaprenyl-diphosphatase [Hymenobacter daecheongensis DSM 21074]|uniref:Undecaprenyl-diphosphatase n=1 Tax=Hymenobacter daecheongensis DSM 21074 TaxID=1121955 RepID=A0A1M6K232_9BACT|nr:phosphatase PAP2 family protein [Hymenobacter daecheongensis]SHJ52912.1 undecaprenyl-diphosphatase [Hymenobacter daecheongensis DSM 21074]